MAKIFKPLGSQPTPSTSFTTPSGKTFTPISGQKKQGGGLLGTLGHIVGQTAADLEHAAINAPAGVYQVGKATVQAMTTPPWQQTAEQRRNSPLANLAIGSAKATAQDIRHPLRHPGYTALDVLGLTALGAGAGARAAAAGKAVRAGEGAGSAAKALTTAPTFGQRTLKVGEGVVHPETSRSALGAAGQKLADKALQRAAARKPGGRAEGLLHRKVGKIVTAEGRTRQAIYSGPPSAVIAAGKHLTEAEQKALQVVAEQASLQGRIRAAEARVASTTGKEQAGHQAELALLNDAKQHLGEAAGKPVFAGKQAPKLNAVLGKMQDVAGSRERLLKDLGLLTDKAIQSRKTSAGRVSLGATYERPTPSKLGQSPALERAVKQRDKLQKRFDTIAAKKRGGYQTVVRPRTEAEARALLAELEARHAKFDQAIMSKMLNPNAKLDKAQLAEQRRINTEAGKIKQARTGLNKSGRVRGTNSRLTGANIPKNVNQELLAQAEAQVAQILDRLPQDHPVVQRYRAERLQIQQLREALTSPEQVFGTPLPPARRMPAYERIAELRQAGVDEGLAQQIAHGELSVRDFEARVRAADNPAARKVALAKLAGQKQLLADSLAKVGKPAPGTAQFGKIEMATFKPGSPTLERIGGALSVANDRVQQLAAAAEKKVKPTGILGQEQFTATPSAVRIPDVATKQGRIGHGAGAVGGQGTIGHQRAPGSVTHEYTGALREHAVRRQDTTRLVGESGLEAAKYAAIKHVHDLARQMTSPVPVRPTDLAVRLDNLGAGDRLPLEVKRLVQDPEAFFQHATPGEAASALDKVKAHLFIDPKTLDPAAAAEFQRLAAEGKIGWVPRKVLGEFAKPQAPLQAVAGKTPVKIVDAVNNAQRFAILYLKPAYAMPNIIGNAALNLLQQGFAAPVNLSRAFMLNHRLGPEVAARIDTLMGEGLARAISSHGRGAGAKTIDWSAAQWSRVVDQPFRRSSFIYEARRAGYRTPKQLEDLVANPAHEADLMRITQTANREIIDYANLTPVEREVVRRVVFFYPWVKGSTVYAGRMLREHPVKSALVGQVGRVGYEQNPLQLPSYLEGTFPVGGGKVINPSSSAILQTPAQVGMTIQGLLSGNIPEAAQTSNFYTPAINLALALATRKDPSSGYSYPGGTSALQVARDQLLSGLPQSTLIRNYRGAGKHPERLFPPSKASAIEQFLFGGIAPRKINQAKAAAMKRQEQARMRTGYGR